MEFLWEFIVMQSSENSTAENKRECMLATK